MVEIQKIREKFNKKYPEKDFDYYYTEYSNLKNFKINENVETVNGISEAAHYIMRLVSTYYMNKVFKAMKIDTKDPNVEEDEDGNIGTAARIVKMWTGKDTNDDRELLSGRWAKKPRLAKFPNTHDTHIPITKRIDISAVCSHHFAPFSSTFRGDAYAVISYIPDEFVLGISKLQRLADWVSQRGWLQEEITQKLYEEIKEAAGTDSVYVKLYNIVHTCESIRGAKSKDGAFTSEYYGGKFKDPILRSQI